MRQTGFIIFVLAASLAAMLMCRPTPAAQSSERGAASERGEAPLFPPSGSSCVVYLRGDAAGVAFHDRIADLGNLISRKGTVVRAEDAWLVLRDGSHQLYIPRTSIMLIDVGK
ncbi:MAG TPA: hypothetical protein VFC78_20185 [Tepidisphaeraceae bacterium]|nr:hypothetical protein [Tepidisphaeraceae bacterium]